MKKLEAVVLVVLSLGAADAMPTKQELAENRTIANELMAPTISAYKSKSKTALEVADAFVAFADLAQAEAARYIFLSRAIGFYVKASEYGKAADIVDRIKSEVKDVPPSEISDIINSAFGRKNSRKSPRLYMQLQLAEAQVRAGKDIRRLSARLKRVRTDEMMRQYAEALALAENWKVALSEFGKVSGAVGKMAQADASGTGESVELGDFWWDYKTCYEGGEPLFKERAAMYYRKAIDGGKVEGLKKTLVEQRLASLVVSDVEAAVDIKESKSKPRPRSSKKPAAAKAPVKNKSGLMHRWSFADGFVDSVGGMNPSKTDNAAVENGVVSLRSCSPLEFPAGTVPLAPFTIQMWASATDRGLGSGGDFIFKIAPSGDAQDEIAYWTWTSGKKWVSRIGGFGDSKKVGHGKCLVDGKRHLYTVTGEKAGKGMLLKFHQDDTIFGEVKTKLAWKKPPMLILGGFVSPVYDEIRVYSRAFSHPDIVESYSLGPENVPEEK